MIKFENTEVMGWEHAKGNMSGSVKAKLEDIKAYVDKDGVYLDLKYKDAKLEDGRKVKVHIPKIRLPIPTKALPDLEEIHVYADGSKWLLNLGTDKLEVIPSKVTAKNGLGKEITRNNVVYIVANQEVTLTEDEVTKILEEKYGCPVDIIKKGCSTCRYRYYHYDEFPCNKCNEQHLWEKGERFDED